MATKEDSKRIHCTFPDCNAVFESQAQLKRHKKTWPEHDYCALCDMDFEDDHAHLLHKIESTRHIVCPICSKDFRSEDGQRLHIRQTHAAEQNIKCVGCNEEFKRAGGLMGHIERNKCTKITAQFFEQRRAQKEIVKAYLADPDGFKSPTTLGSEAGDSEDGGVVLNLDYSSTASRRPSSTVTGPASLAEKKQWPQLDSQAFKNGDQDDLLTGMASLDLPEPALTWGGESSAKLFPNALQNPSTLNWSAPQADDATEDQEAISEHLNPKSKGWNPELFLNPATGKYQCPWNLCG